MSDINALDEDRLALLVVVEIGAGSAEHDGDKDRGQPDHRQNEIGADEGEKSDKGRIADQLGLLDLNQNGTVEAVILDGCRFQLIQLDLAPQIEQCPPGLPPRLFALEQQLHVSLPSNIA